MRSRVRATAAGSRDRSVMISGGVDDGVKRPFGLPFSAAARWVGESAAAGGDDGLIVSVRMPCATAPALAKSASTRTLRQLRSSMVPPFRRRFGPRHSSRKWDFLASAPAVPVPTFEFCGSRLLPGGVEREFAVADAQRKAFREARGSFLAVGGDELGKGGEQACLRQAVSVDAVDARLDPRGFQIAERGPFLFMVRSLLRSLGQLRGHGRNVARPDQSWPQSHRPSRPSQTSMARMHA